MLGGWWSKIGHSGSRFIYIYMHTAYMNQCPQTTVPGCACDVDPLSRDRSFRRRKKSSLARSEAPPASPRQWPSGTSAGSPGETTPFWFRGEGLHCWGSICGPYEVAETAENRSSRPKRKKKEACCNGPRALVKQVEVGVRLLVPS